MTERLHGLAITGQAVCAVAAIAILVLAPPRRGRALLISPSGREGPAINAALAAGARLLGPGPFGGSITVLGDRDRLMAAARRAGLMLLAAPPAGCGSPLQADDAA